VVEGVLQRRLRRGTPLVGQAKLFALLLGCERRPASVLLEPALLHAELKVAASSSGREAAEGRYGARIRRRSSKTGPSLLRKRLLATLDTAGRAGGGVRAIRGCGPTASDRFCAAADASRQCG
jgi:hypothetical protein